MSAVIMVWGFAFIGMADLAAVYRILRAPTDSRSATTSCKCSNGAQITKE